MSPVFVIDKIAITKANKLNSTFPYDAEVRRNKSIAISGPISWVYNIVSGFHY